MLPGVAPSRFERYEPVPVTPTAGWRCDILVAPARLFSANGVTMGPDGRCWVAEAWGGAVSAWNADTDVLTTVLPHGGVISGPDDLALGSDGSIYLTEYFDGNVTAVRPDGTAQVLFDDSPMANGITVDRSGRLFVDEFRPGGRLYELDPRRPGTPRIIAELDHPNALERGADGRLYLQNVAAGTVLSIDPDLGDVRHEFDVLGKPSAVRFDPAGRLVVSDFAGGRVSSYNLATRDSSLLVDLEPGLDNVCFDREGRMFVSNAMTCEIVRVVDGRVDARTGSGFVGPYGVAPDLDGGVLVADDYRVARVGPDGEVRSVWDPSHASWLHRMLDVVRCRDVLYGLSNTGSVLLLEPDYGVVDEIESLSAIDDVTCLATFEDDLCLATNQGTVLILDAALAVVSARPSGLAAVTGLAADARTVVACDRMAGQVAVLDDRGARLYDGFAEPEAVAAVGATMYVIETAARQLVRVSLADGRREAIVTGLPVGNPRDADRHHRRASLAVLADGSLVVGCDGDGSLRRVVASARA